MQQGVLGETIHLMHYVQVFVSVDETSKGGCEGTPKLMYIPLNDQLKAIWVVRLQVWGLVS